MVTEGRPLTWKIRFMDDHEEFAYGQARVVDNVLHIIETGTHSGTFLRSSSFPVVNIRSWSPVERK